MKCSLLVRTISRRRPTLRANTVRPYAPLPIGPVGRGLDPSKASCNNYNFNLLILYLKIIRRGRRPRRPGRCAYIAGGYRISPYGGLKPPLCKGRWHGVSRDGGIGARAGRLMYGQGHNPPPPIGGALRARAPLSLRDISPHCGESPFTQGGLCSMPTKWHLLRAGRWRASAPTEWG